MSGAVEGVALAERLRAAVTYQYMPMSVRKLLSEAVEALTAPPARSYADGVADILRTAQADCGCRIPSPFDEVAEHAIGLALATVSQGEKA